jgi:hypothetical protein
MRTLLCLALLAPLLTAQESFLDADFTFTFSVPEGLVQLDEQELRTFLNIPAEIAYNAPLTDDKTIDVVHNYFWRDPTGMGREISLLIGFSPMGLPWVNPDEYAESVEDSAQMVIDAREPLKAPHPGIQVEGSAERPDGLKMKRIIAYFTMSRNEYAIMSLSARESDWNTIRAELIAAVDTVRFPEPEGPPVGQGGMGGGATPQPGGAPRGNPGQAAQAGTDEKWSSLEVTGSLVLAVILMMGLFAGGKRPA